MPKASDVFSYSFSSRPLQLYCLGIEPMYMRVENLDWLYNGTYHVESTIKMQWPLPLSGESDSPQQILQKLEDAPLQREVRPGMVVELEAPGEYDSDALKAQALANVQSAVCKQEEEVRGLLRVCVCV